MVRVAASAASVSAIPSHRDPLRVRPVRRLPADWSLPGHCPKGPWRVAGSFVLQRALPNAYWAEQRLRGFAEPYHRFRDAERTARCGPARRVVWEGPG